MKKTIIYSLFLFVWAFSTVIYAQKPTSPLERKVIEKALDNFEMYKSCITVADDETKSYFMDLFKSKSVPVYNDLLGITNKSDLNVSDYLDEQKSNMVSPIIKICNVNRDRIWEDNGKWLVQLSFDKSLTFQNQCGINFNTLDFYGGMFRETMILSYDNTDQICRIESITGKIDSDRVLPDDYCILDSTSVKDTKVVYKHRDGTRERVNFNSFGQMLLTSGSDKNQFSYADNDVRVKTNYKPDCHLMTLSYKSSHWRIKPHFDLGLGKALSVENEALYSSVSSKSLSFGVDAGYIFPTKGKFKIGVFLGLGYSTTSLDLVYQTDRFSFYTDQDIDGDSYERIYENLNFSQSTKIGEFSIPVYADFDWRFSRWASLYFDVGIKLNINLSTKVSDFAGSADNVYGIYPDYGNLRLDHQWGYNGFTQNLTLANDNLCNGESMDIKKFAPDLLVGAGFRINIPRTPLALDLGLGYQKSIGNIITGSDSSYLPQYSDNMIYNVMSGEQSTEHVHNLIERAGAISRGFLKLNIGVLIKF